MPSIEALLIFTAAAMILNISPGPSNFYVMARSLGQGAGAGAVAAGGLAFGSLGHVIAAAFGISALFAYSPAAYTVLKVLGAGYLVYLGIRTLRDGGAQALPVAGVAARPLRRIFWESSLVELLNPKTALFFLAFLPQFVDVSAGPVAPQMLLLGLIVTVTAIPCDLFVALASGAAGRLFDRRPWLYRLQSRISGSLLIALGFFVAVARRGD